MSGSRAASWSATPIDLRTSPASVTTSWPATFAVPPVGRRSVVSMRTVVVLPAPFGPEEGVDLTLGDVQVDAAHGLYARLRTPSQAPELRSQPSATESRERAEGLRLVAWDEARPVEDRAPLYTHRYLRSVSTGDCGQVCCEED